MSSSATAIPDCPAVGSAFGRFVVGEPIGAGAMGVVVRAHDPVLERDVALKLVREDQTDDLGKAGRARLVREARSMAKLAHPNVLTILEAGIEDGRVYLAMERVHGGTLRELVAARADAGWQDTVDLYAAAGRGLAAAHRAGLIHRDFKADNVLVDGDRVLVADFGLVGIAREVSIARQPLPELAGTGLDGNTEPGGEDIEDRVTLAGMVVGTPAYMAPEQMRGHGIDARSDQFSFCASLYEALYGQLPFSGKTMSQYLDSMFEDGVRRPPRSRVPTWVHAAILRGLSLDPARRFESMDALLRQLTIDPDKSRFGSRARMIAVVIIISAVILWALVSAFIDYDVSYLALAGVDAGCLALALTVTLALGPAIRAVPFNRKVLGMGIGVIVACLSLVAGGSIAGLPPTATATLHLFTTFCFAVAGAILLDRRLIIPALGYVAGFLVAAGNPNLFFALTALAHTITGATLLRVLEGPTRGL